MKLLISLLFIFASSAAFAGTAGEYDLYFRTAFAKAELPNPVIKAESQMTLLFVTPNSSSPVDPEATIEVSLFMPAHGHGSAETKITRLDTGVYRVSNMYFIMAGEWRVDVILTYADGKKETQSFTINL